MAYCTIADVQALNPKRTYNATSTPTETQVNTLIAQIAEEIDALLQSKGYTFPLSAVATKFAKAMNAYGAAALAEMGMFPEVSEKASTPHWKILWDKYNDYINMIQEPLSDSHVGGFFTSMANQSNYPDPVFRKSSNDKEF